MRVVKHWDEMPSEVLDAFKWKCSRPS